MENQCRHPSHGAIPPLDGRVELEESERQPLNPGAKDPRRTIRVIIAEDQGMVLGALAALLEIEGDISVIAKARNGKEALQAVLAEKPTSSPSKKTGITAAISGEWLAP